MVWSGGEMWCGEVGYLGRRLQQPSSLGFVSGDGCASLEWTSAGANIPAVRNPGNSGGLSSSHKTFYVDFHQNIAGQFFSQFFMSEGMTRINLGYGITTKHRNEAIIQLIYQCSMLATLDIWKTMILWSNLC